MFYIYKREDSKNFETKLEFIKTESTKQDAIKTCQELNKQDFGQGGYAPYCWFEK